MKKILVSFLALIILLTTSLLVNASDEIEVYVSISDDKLLMSYEKIIVSDIDSDGKITINDALYCAHDLKYPGGAAEGFKSSMGAYGLKIDILWGKDNGDSYGYYVNNNSAMSLGDEIKAGDHVYAFLYTDLVNWSDTYSFFDKNEVKSDVGETFSLTLSFVGYDESWNAISNPLMNADIYANGSKLSNKTDENGKVDFKFDKAGTYVITAKSDKQTLVPPVCIVYVVDDNEIDTEPAKPGDKQIFLVYTIICIASFCALISYVRKNIYEK